MALKRLCGGWFQAAKPFGKLLPLTAHRFSSSASQQTSDEQQLILVEDDEKGVRRLTLNSLRKRNALSLAMLDELKSQLVSGADTHSVKVIIIGHNGNVFSAGHDLKELTSTTGSEYHQKIFSRCSQVMNLVQDIPVPVIAEVNGVATAAGCQLVATCDLAVAAEHSIFATPGVHIGLFCSTPGVAVARSMAKKHALEMLLTGDSINAQDALRYGLLNRIVPKEELESTTNELAWRIASHSRGVISMGKAGFYRQIKENRDDAYCLTGDLMVENLKMGDAQEGIDAFFKKRKPVWKE